MIKKILTQYYQQRAGFHMSKADISNTNYDLFTLIFN